MCSDGVYRMGNVTEYNGSEKYIFVSYCHKDKERVRPIISALASQGYRVWFDSGIYPGTEWPEVIAGHLEKCSAFIACVSGNSIQSHNCRNELNYAILKGKPFIGVILERVQLTPGMEMQMAAFQSLYYYNFKTFGEFFDRLTEAPCLEPCRGAIPEAPIKRRPTPAPTANPAAAEKAPTAAVLRAAAKSAVAPNPAMQKAVDSGKPAVKKVLVCAITRLKTGEVIPVNRPEFSIGRKKELCSYAVTDNPAISRVHAVLRISGGAVTLCDNESLNQTFLNGTELPKGGTAVLKNGDEFSVADERFIIRMEFREIPQK